MDASVTNDGRTCLGIVVRDHMRLMRLATGKTIYASLEPVVGESLAIQLGLEAAASMDCIILESDCQVAVGMLNSSMGDLRLQGKIIEECLVLRRSFFEFRCSWVRRDANKLANEVASYVSNNSRSEVVLDRIQCISSTYVIWIGSNEIAFTMSFIKKKKVVK
ncbi:hypothetical protein Droror1_Dr00023277 [Drosera rotundifolia]